MHEQLLLLRLYCELNLNKEAVILASELIEKEGELEDLYFHRGLALQNEGNFLEAKEDFHRVLKINSNHMGAKMELASLFLQRTETESAKEYLLSLKKANKKNPEIFHMLGLISYMSGEEKKAVRYWRKTLKLAPGHRGALENLKLLNVNLDEPQSLEETLKQNEIRAQRSEIESKVKELEVLEYYENDPYSLYWGRKGLVFLHKTEMGAFSYLNGEVHHQILKKKGARELLKILLSTVFTKLLKGNNELFIEADYGRGQYFIYHGKFSTKTGWESRREGKFQEKKVPVFLKSRILSSEKVEDLPLYGNLFLMKHDKEYVCFDNWGTDSDYTVYDTWESM